MSLGIISAGSRFISTREQIYNAKQSLNLNSSLNLRKIISALTLYDNIDCNVVLSHNTPHELLSELMF